MKTLLIVEDEKLIRQGIKTMVQRSGVPVEMIFECANGEKALEILQTEEIQVMFTDIRMPKMDGIELVSHLPEFKNPPLTVAISGYDDFSYAVDMLRNGVREYLLKPVERDKIADVLRKLDAELSRSEQEKDIDRMAYMQQLKFLLLQEDYEEEKATPLFRKYESLFPKKDYIVAVAGNDCKTEELTDTLILQDFPYGCVCILPFEENSDIPEELQLCATGISYVHTGMQSLRRAYEEAVVARKTAFCKDACMRIDACERKVPEELHAHALKYISENAMIGRLQLIGTDRTEEMLNAWKGLFEEAIRLNLRPDEFSFGVKSFLQEARKVYRNLLSEEDRERMKELENIFSFADIHSYKEELTEFVVSIHERVNREDAPSANETKIEEAIQYMRQNYKADLNMAVVSNYVSMNYSLFSFSFKQYTGKTFVEYLRELRMSEAKRMLAQTEEKIVEIAREVGYENDKHFLKTFRSIYGVSPTEYRKNMRR